MKRLSALGIIGGAASLFSPYLLLALCLEEAGHQGAPSGTRRGSRWATRRIGRAAGQTSEGRAG
jgi:hypothetical protein